MNTNVKDHSAAFGWVGILAVAAFCITWLACYQADGSWTWGVDSISDFGVSIYSDAADYFNYGCVITGVLLAIYGVGRAMYGNSVGFTVAGIMLVLAGICVAMVGVFTNDYNGGDYHDFFVVLTAIFLVAAMIAVAVQQYYNGMILPVGVTMIILLAIIILFIDFTYNKFECYAIVGVLVWTLMDGALLVANGINGGKQ